MLGNKANHDGYDGYDDPDPARVNLGDPQTFADYDLSGYWRTLRSTRPLYWHPAVGDSPGFWVPSRYDDIVALYRDDVTFRRRRSTAASATSRWMSRARCP